MALGVPILKHFRVVPENGLFPLQFRIGDGGLVIV